MSCLGTLTCSNWNDDAVNCTRPISYWHLSETGGTTFADSIDSNNGSCSAPNCPTPSDGGQLFNGSSDVILASDMGLPTGANHISVSFKFKTTYSGSPDLYFLSYGSNIAGEAFAIGMYNNGKIIFTNIFIIHINFIITNSIFHSLT